MLKLYGHLFPEQAEAETRTMTIIDGETLPDDEYAMLEAYCTDPACDCRRVMLNVVGRRQGPLATISFGFDRESMHAGPYLDPVNRQSVHSPALLERVRDVVLSDPDYVRRLERHYAQMKSSVAGTSHSGQAAIEGSGIPPMARKSQPQRKRKR